MANPPENTTHQLGLPLLAVLALLAAAAPFATDLYLPTFPQMVTDLSTSTTGVQLSLTAFLVGAGVGQVVFGPLSDRVGRRRPLVWGTVVYVLASVAAAAAPTVPLLVAARLTQGLTGAAGMVIGRAVISDRARGPEAARAFSIMMLVGGLAPVVAPLAGSMLAAPLGWRGLLWLVAGLATLAMIGAAVVVPETRPTAVRDAEPTSRSHLRLLANRRFIGDAVAFSFAFATMMAYISASPFLYQDLMGFSQVGYGLMFGANALVLGVVSALSAKLTHRFTPAQIARTGLWINLGAIVVIAVLALSHAAAIWLAAPILVAVSALGLVFGPVTALALDQVPGAGGLGSAALGLLQFGLAGAVAPLVSIGGLSPIPLAATMLVASVVANVMFLASGKRLAHLPHLSAEEAALEVV